MGAGGAFIGALAGGASQSSVTPAIAIAAALAGYVVGTAWAAAQLGWALGGDGTFWGAMLGATLGACVGFVGAVVVATIPFRSPTPVPVISSLTPALIAWALAVPALGASVAFEATYDFERRRVRAKTQLSPTVLLDGGRPGIGLALGGAF
jgi:hypothetical protein